MTERQSDIFEPEFVKGVFDRCSEKYIWFSYVCSMGFTERWRRQCVQELPEPKSGGRVCYDMMAGTGEVWPHLLSQMPEIENITAIDISSGMHKRAMERLHQHRAHKISFVEDNILKSALEDESADVIVSTFGLKTFNPAQQSQLAGVISRVLKPGGSFSLIEASDPKGWWLRPLYRFHLTKLLPIIERIFLSGAQDFAMIGEYSTRFSCCEGIRQELEAAGLEVSYRRYFFGCATGVVGRKPLG